MEVTFHQTLAGFLFVCIVTPYEFPPPRKAVVEMREMDEQLGKDARRLAWMLMSAAEQLPQGSEGRSLLEALDSALTAAVESPQALPSQGTGPSVSQGGLVPHPRVPRQREPLPASD